jgi:hypothetical protein
MLRLNNMEKAMTQASIEDMKQSVAQEIGKARLKLQTIQQTYSMLTEYIFQTVSSAKSQETNELRLETMSNGMQEIKKYAEQEVQKYTHDLGVLAGKLQGLDIAYNILQNDQVDEEEDELVGDDDE